MRRLIVAVAFCVVGCGSSGDGADAAPDVVYGHRSLDAAVYEAALPETGPWDRMAPHAGTVLAVPTIQVIYIDQLSMGGSQTFDAYLTWLLGSTSYWSILAQYGVGYGTLQGSLEIDGAVFFTSGMLTGGIVNWQALEQRVRDVIHQSPFDAGSDSGDAAVAQLPPIPIADAYIFFLPGNVTVDLGVQGTTCGKIGGYHAYDGSEPYAIIPVCGRDGFLISHEMAEMATDPLPGSGWFSDADQGIGGGEIGDLCEALPSVNIDGNHVTPLWSNKDGQCVP